jgi:hypothetical protein
MDRLQRKNIGEIEGLNQRGGRTLSFVDLVRAGTMTVEMVAHCWTAIARGASFITAAGPGGAGKSTVLADLLSLLPPTREIVTITDPRVIDEEAVPCCLAHEIGEGHWYGYIWGKDVRNFFALMGHGTQTASCIHADGLQQLRDILLAPPLSVAEEHLNKLDLVLFIQLNRRRERRVTALYEGSANGAGHRLAFEWDPETDTILRHGDSELFWRLGTDESEYHAKLAAVNRIVHDGDEAFEFVRAKVLDVYGSS